MDEPNPPIWPTSVKLFHPDDDPEWRKEQLESTQDPWDDEKESYTSDKHFSRQRTALLFAPGVYKDVDVQVGYYVQLAGLGKSASDVQFVDSQRGPFVPALNKHLHQRTVIDKTTGKEKLQPVGTCLDSFWRSAENFSLLDTDLQWAVSQAAPLRRVRVLGDVILHDGAAYASGGHLANADIQGTLYGGGQQQYLLRNVHFGNGADGGAWSMVYVGCTGNVPTPTVGSPTKASITVVKDKKTRIEKPYIALKEESNTEFQLRVPLPLLPSDPRYTDKPLLDGLHEDVRDFSRVRVMQESDPIEDIQKALDQGKDVVLSPGIYALKETIQIRRPNQVLLGLGLATLEAPLDGSACIHVSSGVPGVRVAGIMLEATENTGASNVRTRSLLEWGEEDTDDAGIVENPGALFDIFVRVGGAQSGNRSNFAVDVMMRIHSGHVIGDNLWIWRADHATLGPGEEANYPDISPIFWQSEQDEYRAETGIEVSGDDVTMYGLAVEHANGHQTIWSGQRGSVHFYQCEFPYGVDRNFAERNFRGYLVAEEVDDHTLYAPGIYSNFRNDQVFVSTAIEHPDKAGITMVNPFTVKLDNQGGILSILNGKGDEAIAKGNPVRLGDESVLRNDATSRTAQ